MTQTTQISYATITFEPSYGKIVGIFNGTLMKSVRQPCVRSFNFYCEMYVTLYPSC